MQKNKGEEVKVVIRTRPTPDFAAKNIAFDQDSSVSSCFKLIVILLDGDC